MLTWIHEPSITLGLRLQDLIRALKLAIQALQHRVVRMDLHKDTTVEVLRHPMEVMVDPLRACTMRSKVRRKGAIMEILEGLIGGRAKEFALGCLVLWPAAVVWIC